MDLVHHGLQRGPVEKLATRTATPIKRVAT